MDFFSQQDSARRNTTLLVLLFVAAIVTLILITNLMVTLVVWSLAAPDGEVIASLLGGQWLAQFHNERFVEVSLVVGGLVAIAMLYKHRQLASGGKSIAEALGGLRVLPNCEDPALRRLHNVVEEMALAAGMPVPSLYLLPNEGGINAFAAGYSPSDAVIGVTQGCLQQLNRPQLQGVIAHEFSHILNGDMRLNLRLIALLHGIQCIGLVGRLLLRTRPTSSSKRGGGQLVLLGAGLVAVGWLGLLFGNLIRATVSRQREYLADASAVQFTRNPDGIADALKIIGGYSGGTAIQHPRGQELSHLFFAHSLRLRGWLATHPPLLERILRIQPHWDGGYIPRQPPPPQVPADPLELAAQRAQRLGTVALGLGQLADHTESPPIPSPALTPLQQLPQRLLQQAHDPLGAMALVYTLLLHDALSIRQQQLALINQLAIDGLTACCQRLWPQLQVLDTALRLPLLEVCLPALKSMPTSHYPPFKRTLLQLIRLDRRTELLEWCLYQLVRQYLAPEFEPPRPPRARYRDPQQVAPAFQLVLSLLAHAGQSDQQETARSFSAAAQEAGLAELPLLPAARCEIGAFSRAVRRLAECQPKLKARLLQSLIRCVEQDNQITALERELLRAIAAVLESPLPQLHAGPANPSHGEPRT